jgi:hypothetical protein
VYDNMFEEVEERRMYDDMFEKVEERRKGKLWYQCLKQAIGVDGTRWSCQKSVMWQVGEKERFGNHNGGEGGEAALSRQNFGEV